MSTVASSGIRGGMSHVTLSILYTTIITSAERVTSFRVG